MCTSAMEDFYMYMFVCQGPTAHPVHFPCPPLLCMWATTRAGMCSAPCRDRLCIRVHMAYYSPVVLRVMFKRSANVFNMAMYAEGATVMSRRSRGTPRVSNRCCKRIRDLSVVSGKSPESCAMVDHALYQCQVDAQGLYQMYRKLLTFKFRVTQGGPVCLSTMSANIGVEMATM